MDCLLKSTRIYTGYSALDGYVLVENGTVTKICKNKPHTNTEFIDMGDKALLPGFIDIHTHGGNGFDAMDSGFNAINSMSLHKMREGVTSFFPSTVTDSIKKITAAVKNIAGAARLGVQGARIGGIFVEGPYINLAYKGAHVPEYIKNVDIYELAELKEASDGLPVAVAIAPENEMSAKCRKYLYDHFIVKIGHSAATAEQTHAAIQAGARVCIHTYNAMSAFNHREPGMAGAVLADNDIYCELICDFVHVHEDAVKILYKCKSDKLVLITDSMRACGLADGIYGLGEREVTVINGTARTKEGNLAGSTLRMNTAAKNIKNLMKLEFDELINYTSINPAKAMGIYDTVGSIELGKRADIVAVNDELDVCFAMAGDNLYNNLRSYSNSILH